MDTTEETIDSLAAAMVEACEGTRYDGPSLEAWRSTITRRIALGFGFYVIADDLPLRDRYVAFIESERARRCPAPQPIPPEAIARPRPEITIAATDAIALALGAIETLDRHATEFARSHETAIGAARALNAASRMYVAAIEAFARAADAASKPTCAPEDISGIADLEPGARDTRLASDNDDAVEGW